MQKCPTVIEGRMFRNVTSLLDGGGVDAGWSQFLWHNSGRWHFLDLANPAVHLN